MPILLPSKRHTLCVCTLFSLSLFLAPSSAMSQKIKTVPAKPTSAGSGEEMYNSYCASCHGKDGKGDGPAAPALKDPVPDLTTLAQRNGGKFPQQHVAAVIRFGAEAHAAHGSPDMPIWGPIFGGMHQSSASPEVQLRINNLSHYLETLQVK
ncbi:MAG TPA: c-type cytochrome [Edaphobacter sp.]|nr:c-type cytochrome [Edaphobacter sp.]